MVLLMFLHADHEDVVAAGNPYDPANGCDLKLTLSRPDLQLT